ncbi:hypothetical protein HZS_1347 [Henneguya salminicola]|nr:hypothetical protein HZS_1347 [Henneguya salminicola]
MEISGLTNNALERYNRRLNDFFVNSHPNLASFVSIIKNEFLLYRPLFYARAFSANFPIRQFFGLNFHLRDHLGEFQRRKKLSVSRGWIH